MKNNGDIIRMLSFSWLFEALPVVHASFASLLPMQSLLLYPVMLFDSSSYVSFLLESSKYSRIFSFLLISCLFYAKSHFDWGTPGFTEVHPGTPDMCMSLKGHEIRFAITLLRDILITWNFDIRFLWCMNNLFLIIWWDRNKDLRLVDFRVYSRKCLV